MVSTRHAEVQKLKELYGTPYFVWTGGISLTQARSGKGLAIMSGLFFPPILPYSAWYALTPDYDTFIYTMVYDIESGKYLIVFPKTH